MGVGGEDLTPQEFGDPTPQEILLIKP